MTSQPNFFQAAFLINRDADSDRLQRAAARLRRHGFEAERFAAITPPVQVQEGPKTNRPSGLAACAASHRALLSLIERRGLERALIFEDDVVLRDDAAEWLERLIPQLNAVAWDVFYLGLHLMRDAGMVTENLGRVGRGHHTHAYAVTRAAIPKLIACIDRPPEKCRYTFDSYDDESLVKVYARPIVAVQEPNFSNTLGKPANRLEQYFSVFDGEDFFEHCAEARTWDLIASAQAAASKALSRRRVGKASGNGKGAVAANAGKAMLCQRTGKTQEAAALWKKVLDVEPEHPAALHYSGMLAYQRGQVTAAVDLLFRSLAADPECPEFHNNLAVLLNAAGRADDSLELLDEAVRLKPDYAEAEHNRGIALEKLGRIGEAEAAWRRSAELKAGYFEPRNRLGHFLLKTNRAAEAVVFLREAAKVNPRMPQAQLTLGNALREVGDLPGAVAAYRKCVEVRPDWAEAHSNLGAALNETGNPEEAEGALKKSISLKRDSIDAHWNLALVLLARGDFSRGWLEYEWRRRLENQKGLINRFTQPEWNGCDVAGLTVLIQSEQGLGDTIQFIRFAPLLARRGAKVIVECQPKLCPLLRKMEGIEQVVARGEPLPFFDTHVRLLSLPGILHTRVESIPEQVPYLKTEPEREKRWKRKIGNVGFNIGIAWQGSSLYKGDRFRSIPLEHFAALARVPGVRLWSLQKGTGSEQIAKAAFPIMQFDEPMDEEAGAFVDTAAAMKGLDLVVSSDTSVPHVAGALGAAVWLALPYAADWRWLISRDDCPWYPTMRLFRQETFGDWAGVFERIAGALRQRVGAAEETAPAAPLLAPVPPGQLIDRITILQIKAKRVTDAAKLRNVRAELGELCAVRDATLPRCDELDALERDLRTVNETLWRVEDDIRLCDAAGDFGPKFVELARTVYQENDRRAELKRKIDSFLGSCFVEEKQYARHSRELVGAEA
jgi:Flp pilus assembly protein TadD